MVPPLYTVNNPPRSNRRRKADSLDIERLLYFGPWVHHILLHIRPVEEIAQILTACPNVHDLALWIIRGNGAHLLPILARLPLRRLSFDPSSFFCSSAEAPDCIVPLTQAPFDALTHLEVINVSGGWNLWHELALLPRLTHLALEGSQIEEALIERALAECAALEVLVLPYADDLHAAGDELQMAEMQKDPRVVVLLYSNTGGCLDEWEIGAGGGEDFWITAEERVRNARLGGPAADIND